MATAMNLQPPPHNITFTCLPQEIKNQIYKETYTGRRCRILFINMVQFLIPRYGNQQRKFRFYSPTRIPEILNLTLDSRQEAQNYYRKSFGGADLQPMVWVDFNNDLVLFKSYVLKRHRARDKELAVEPEDLISEDRLGDWKHIRKLVLRYEDVEAWFGGEHPRAYEFESLHTVYVTDSFPENHLDENWVWMDTNCDPENDQWDDREEAAALIRIASGPVDFAFGEIVHIDEIEEAESERGDFDPDKV